MDFYCHSEKLVLEIDGSIHNSQEAKIKDEVRQIDLENLGLKVARFTTTEIKHEIEIVFKTIDKISK